MLSVFTVATPIFLFFLVENGQRPTRTKLKPMREISLDYISQNRKMKETTEQDKKHDKDHHKTLI